MIRAATPGRRTLRVGHWVWLATDHGGRLARVRAIGADGYLVLEPIDEPPGVWCRWARLSEIHPVSIAFRRAWGGGG
jgi:hypothetical protein